MVNNRKPIRILFVCHGNICRSPMAEFVLRHMAAQRGLSGRFTIASAATSDEEIGNPVHRGTVRKLAEVNVPVDPDKRATQLTCDDYDAYDYLIGMDGMNERNMRRILPPDDAGKIARLLDYTDHPRDISDPWYTGNFDETYRDIHQGCEALLHALTNR